MVVDLCVAGAGDAAHQGNHKAFSFFIALRFFCFELFDVVLGVAGAGDAAH